MSIRLLVDADEYWPAFVADARKATSRLFVQVLSFEADAAGRQLADLLLELGPRVDRRLLIDDYSRYFINDRFLYAPGSLTDWPLWREARDTIRLVNALERDGVAVRWTNPIRWRMYRLSARNHKKISVIDNRAAYFGGINVSEHNFAWHDAMLRADDPELVQCLAEDFMLTCQGRNQAVARTFDEGQLILLDGLHGDELLGGLFHRIAHAKEVFVESPYVSAPFFDPMREATQRGARVICLVPESNNWGWYDAYSRIECYRRGIELHYYQGPMNHLKAMLIDGELLVAGSCNFDYFSFHGHQELLFVTTHQGLVRDLKTRVFGPDFERARRVPLSGEFSWQTQWTSLRVRAGFPALKWFCRHF